MSTVPQLDKEQIDDVIVAMLPEAETRPQHWSHDQFNGIEHESSGMTVNRYCASGLKQLRLHRQDPMPAWRIASSVWVGCVCHLFLWRMENCSQPLKLVQSKPGLLWGMGLTGAEAVAREYKVSREDQDMFGYESNMKAVKAIQEGKFKNEIVPVNVNEVYLDENGEKENSSVCSRYG